MEIHFYEVQKFRQWWLWLLLIGMLLIPLYGIYKQIFQGGTFGNQPLSDVGLLLYLLFMLLFVAFFWFLQLETSIDNRTIEVRFTPLAKRTIPWEEVVEAEVVNYGFVGGWGVRFSAKYGTVYNVSGNKGLALKLRNGKKLCIGTQKPAELAAMIKEKIRETRGGEE